MEAAILDPVLAPPADESGHSTGVRIYTDGSILKNPGGAGGWAIVIVHDDEVQEIASGGQPQTTNNVMELRAVMEALELCNPPQRDLVEIICDSQYVTKGLTEWMPKWKRQNWMRKAKGGAWEPVKNQWLWEKLDALYNPEFVTITWIRGHDGDRFNEVADKLAGEAARNVRDL